MVFLYIERVMQQQRLDSMFRKFNNYKGIWRKSNKYICLSGPIGCGKTTFLKHFAEKEQGFYFSCKNLTSAMILRLLGEKLSALTGEQCLLEGWPEVLLAMAKHRKQFNRVYIFDDADMILKDEQLQNALLKLSDDEFPGRLFIIFASTQHTFPNVYYDYTLHNHLQHDRLRFEMKHLSIADLIRLFPKFSTEDQLAVYSLTGGVPEAVLPLLGAQDAKDAFRLCLESEAYHRFAERVFSQIFRSPDSYMMLCYAIATGLHKNSEIAHYAGFALNKCDKYLKSLMEAGIIEKRTEKGKTLGYYFANPYYFFWFKYVYAEKNATSLEELEKELKAVADYEFYRACMNYAYFKLERRYPMWNRTDSEIAYDESIYHRTYDLILRFGSDQGYCKAAVKIFDQPFLGKKELEDYLENVRDYFTSYEDAIFFFVRGRYAEGIIKPFKKKRRYSDLHIITPKSLRFN